MLRGRLSSTLHRRPLALQFARRGAFVQPRNRALPAQLRKARLRGEPPPEKWPLAIKTAQTIDGVISHLFLLGFWPSTWLVFFFGAFLGSGALTARWIADRTAPMPLAVHRATRSVARSIARTQRTAPSAMAQMARHTGMRA